MPKNTQTGMDSQVATAEAVMSLLSVTVARNGHSLSWYTSKKGRTWVTLVGFSPIRYTTSAEVERTSTDQEIRESMLVLLAEHLPKLMQAKPPLPTWITRKNVQELLPSAIEYCAELYARWQAGEMFWEESYPDAPGLHLEAGDEPSS